MKKFFLLLTAMMFASLAHATPVCVNGGSINPLTQICCEDKHLQCKVHGSFEFICTASVPNPDHITILDKQTEVLLSLPAICGPVQCPIGQHPNLNGACVCENNLPPVEGSCGTPTTHALCPDGSPAPDNDVTKCACVHGDCTIHLTKKFDFNVQMGGVNANLYVCEAGFYSTCKDCEQHYLQVAYDTDNNPETPPVLNTTKIVTFDTFTPEEHASYANVYINDLYFGTKFYVKYCVDVKRLVVGDTLRPAGIVAYDANISPSWSIQTGAYAGPGLPTSGANDYYSISKLGATVNADCVNGLKPGNPLQGSFSTSVGLISGALQQGSLPVNTVDLCGTPGCHEKQCVYTILFNETATCYRPFKCETVGGEKVCKPYESTIYTTFNADVNFDCQDGVCGN